MFIAYALLPFSLCAIASFVLARLHARGVELDDLSGFFAGSSVATLLIGIGVIVGHFA